MSYENFGDASIEYGQVWISSDGGDDYAPIVTVLSGSDIGLADNQYLIERGSIYFSPDNWNSALACLGDETIGPPQFLDIAFAFYCYQGFDRDYWRGSEVVQVGKNPDDWTARGTTCDEPDVVLHGNASIEKYLAKEYLDA